MALRFRSKCHDDHIEIALEKSGLLGASVVPKDQWLRADGHAKPTIRRLLSLVDEGKAEWRGDKLLVQNAEAAEFSSSFSSHIGLTDQAAVQVEISFIGTIGSKDLYVQTAWRETGYQTIDPKRTGIQIRWGTREGRLHGALFRLVDAIDRFNQVAGDDIETKVARWADVTAAIAQVSPNVVEADAYTKNLTVFQAGSFALDIRDGSAQIDFDPILMSRSKARSLEDNAPTEDPDVPNEDQNPFDDLRDAEIDRLLTAEDQRAFLKSFDSADATRRAYPIRRNTYLLIDPDLVRALDVVKRVRGSSEADKRDFIKNPRAALSAALGLDADQGLSTALFIETKQYSDRVTGLGLWEPPDLSWLSKAQTGWLPERFPVRIGEKEIEIEREEVEKLQDAVATAEASGSHDLPFRNDRISLDDARSALDQIRTRADAEENRAKDETEEETTSEAEGQSAPRHERIVVQIESNIDGVTYKVSRKPRHAFISLSVPEDRMGRTSFKPHQVDGFQWLVNSWVAGWPGVILADDMGLGKTFQGLAFLAWISENQAVGLKTRNSVKKPPILIVAPTALLENWIKESEKHLAPGALGANRADVFGSGINKFRNLDKDTAREPLDWRKLDDHDWILTTYETLADNQTAFAKIKCSVALFDEIQKIKDPGTLNTFAAKSVNADFVLGLSGTPIENRIEDLWSITDRVFPSLLGDLKAFSATYRDADAERYRVLSDKLLKPLDGAPAIMLRRMKDDVLEGLPKKSVKLYPTDMPTAQADCYAKVVKTALAAGKRERGAMLEVVQKLRGISLFPSDATKFDLSMEKECLKWIEQSARLGRTFEILRDIERRGEKALIFVEHRSMQTLLAEAISTLFDMKRPLIINGATPGARRQGLVDDFESRRDRFDLMLLSPKAAGVGLTIVAANHVIHLSRWWNPAVEDQCNDRVYRIGQNKPVTIHVPMATHPVYKDDSFDVKLNRLLDRKRQMSKNLLMPPISDADLGDIFADVTRMAA